MATTTLSNEEILEAIGNKTVLELADLIEAFKTKFNVTSRGRAAAAGGGGAAAAGGARGRREDGVRPSSSRPAAPRRSRSSRWSARSPAWA